MRWFCVQLQRRLTAARTPSRQARAVITYEYKQSVTIAEVRVIQHANGIGMIEGFAGNSLDSLKSVGAVYSNRGRLQGGSQWGEREVSVFRFDPKLVRSGTFFKLIVRETTLANG